MKFEDFILDSLDTVGEINFELVIKTLIVSLIIFWFFVVFWVWSDAKDRSTNILFPVISVLLVAPLNLPGLFIYLLVRPKDTIESLFWADLERRYLIHETADLGDCVKCGYQLSPDFNVCPQCATPSRVECTQCKAMVRTDWKFCPICSNQMLTRRVPEKEITLEIMEKNLEEAKEQAISAVENNKIRYKSREGILIKVGKPVIAAVREIAYSIDTSMRSVLKQLKSRSKEDINSDSGNVNQSNTSQQENSKDVMNSDLSRLHRNKKRRNRRKR